MEYTIVKAILLFTRLLPTQWIYTVCKALAALIFRLDPKRRHITLTNLERAHIGKDEHERLILAKKIYESVGILVAEIFLMMQQRINIDEMVEDYDQTIHDMNAALANKGNGILFLTAHFGNWELLAHFFAKTWASRSGDWTKRQ